MVFYNQAQTLEVRVIRPTKFPPVLLPFFFLERVELQGSNGFIHLGRLVRVNFI